MISYVGTGIFLILLSSFLISKQVFVTKFIDVTRERMPLSERSVIYEAWSSPVRLNFTCYFFNVTNPDEVMNGENPSLVEYGPFTYTEILEKQIIDVDNENDEIKYTTRSTYIFNKRASLRMSKHDKVTILNPAYIGTILTLTSLPPDFMQKYGNNIPKLFPNRSSIFLKARATDLLFEGVKVSCNLRKFPELNLICKTLKANPPPVLRETDRNDVYLFSFFQRLNGSLRGPFTVTRGVQNLSKLGDITSYQNKRVQTLWNSDSCNTVRGTDTITWAPLLQPLPFVSTFIPDLCRTIEVDYQDDVTIHGITGSEFVMKERMWIMNETQCYCPIVNDEPECLPQGLIDVSKCQKIPTILSEPHFLHGDRSLFNYARGLTPNEDIHKTYIVIEPYTGTPLSGQKKMQVNMKLDRQPVELLYNVSEGYFPIVWCENGNTPTLSSIAFTYQVLRLVNLVRYLQYIPLIIGIYIILINIILRGITARKVHPKTANAQSILISSIAPAGNIVQRPRQIFR